MKVVYRVVKVLLSAAAFEVEYEQLGDRYDPLKEHKEFSIRT
jgi:hypothetical protein